MVEEKQSPFDQSAARVVAAYAERGSNRADYERAWTAFYNEHLRAVMNETKLYAKARGLGYESDDIRIEICVAILDVLARGAELNRRVVYGIRRNVLGDLERKVSQISDESVKQRIAEQFIDLNDSDAVDTRGMRHALEALINELEQRQPESLKVRILRVMLRDPEWSWVSIARELGCTDGGVKSTCYYLFRDIRVTRPDLAEYLELPEPHPSFGLQQVSEGEKSHNE